MEKTYYPDEVTDFFLRLAFLCGIAAFLLMLSGINAALPVVIAVFAVACSMFPAETMPLFLVIVTLRNIVGAFCLGCIWAVFYFVIIIPISLVLKLFGTDMLDLFLELGKTSYWVNRSKRDWNFGNETKGRDNGNNSAFGGDPGKERRIGHRGEP